MTTLDYALQYLKKNKWSIIPVGDDKRPLISWKEYQTRLPTEVEVKKWFENGGNIGIITGKISGITVVDVEQGGDYKDLPETLISKTGGGGFHFYYLYQPGFKNVARIRELTDIRNDGGFVVAPPSHTTKGSYTWLRHQMINVFPEDLFLDCVNNKNEKTIEIPAYIGISKGGRNDAMTKYVGKIMPLFHPLDWDNKTWSAIIGANKQNNPPLDENELKLIFESIKKREKVNPSFRKSTNSQIPEEKVEDTEILLMSEVAKRQQTVSSQIYPTDIAAFDNVMLGGFKDGDLVIITGITGHGKTSFAQTLTCNFARKNYGVLFFSYEVMIPNIWQKFKDMGMSDSSIVYSPVKTASGSIDWIEERILDAIKKYNAKVVVIDHLGFLLPKKARYDSQMSQNYSAYLGGICRDLKLLAISNKIVIILLVHTRKTDNPTLNDIKDSAGIAQEADYVFIIQRLKATQGDSQNAMLYSDESSITIFKNRLTGQTPRLVCILINSKFREKYKMEI